MASWCERLVYSSNGCIRKFQSVAGVPHDLRSWTVPGKLFFYVMSVGSFLGDHEFYGSVLPLAFWIWNLEVARYMIIGWCMGLYVGQYIKDLLQLPRPFLHPDKEKKVLCLEGTYSAEYGMPSTHVTTATVIPAMIVMYSVPHLDGSISPNIFYALAVAWFLLCSMSRIYMGVHSVADVVGGALVGAFCIWVIPIIGPILDEWVFTTSPWVVAGVCTVVVWAAIGAYPIPCRHSTSPGDTMIVLAVWMGAMISYSLDPALHRAAENLPIGIVSPLRMAQTFLATVGNVVICGVVYVAIKEAAAAALLAILGPRTAPRHDFLNPKEIDDRRRFAKHKAEENPKDAERILQEQEDWEKAEAEVPRNRRYDVELTYKFIAFVAVGIVAVHLAPSITTPLVMEGQVMRKLTQWFGA